MSRIKFEIVGIIANRQTVICLDNDCIFKKECANHASAGDFRSEDGFKPQLFVLNEKTEVDCLTKDQQSKDCIRDDFLMFSLGCFPSNYEELGIGMFIIK